MKTYFLVPGWDVPSSSPLLGSIIANPSQPDTALYTPPLSSLSLSASSPSSYSSVPSATPTSPPAALFATFLSHYGLGDEPSLSFDRKHILSYSFVGQKLREGVPSIEVLKGAVGDSKVKVLFANQVGVYIVTGVKTVGGAGVSIPSHKGGRWTVNLSIAAPEGEEGREIIFAVEVKEVKVGEGDAVELGKLEEGEGELQARLDREFGEGTFKVVKGVDEMGKEEVQIVTASPTYVDLLTAGTAKVGGLHGIWA